MHVTISNLEFMYIDQQLICDVNSVSNDISKSKLSYYVMLNCWNIDNFKMCGS